MLDQTEASFYSRTGSSHLSNQPVELMNVCGKRKGEERRKEENKKETTEQENLLRMPQSRTGKALYKGFVELLEYFVIITFCYMNRSAKA